MQPTTFRVLQQLNDILTEHFTILWLGERRIFMLLKSVVRRIQRIQYCEAFSRFVRSTQ